MRGTAVRKDLSGLSRLERIDELRSRMNAVTGAQGTAQSEREMPALTGEDDALDVGLPLSLPRRAITEVSDCPALVVELISQVSAAGGHVGIVGWPQLSLAGIEHLDHIVTVPDPGADPLGITSVLVEGLDLVIQYSSAPLNLSPVRVRPLAGRLRKGMAALVLVGLKAPSPALRIDAEVTAYRGIQRGAGRITGLDVEVAMTAKSNRARTTLTLGASAPRSHLKAI